MNKPSKSQVLYERNMELQKAYAEVSSLTEQRDHWQQQALSKSELVAALEARCIEAEQAEANSHRCHEATIVRCDAAEARCRELEAALRKIAAFDPGVFRPLADEIAINNTATDALRDPCPSAASGDNTQNLFLFPSKCCKCGKVDFFQEPQKGIYFCSYGCT